MSNEPIGIIRQPLVGGDLVKEPADRERYGLVTLGNPQGACSGCLLRPDWVISAAHCVEMAPRTPDPNNPGQNVTFNPAQVNVFADWEHQPGAKAKEASPPQSIPAARIVTFRPYDIALLQLTRPMDTVYTNDRLLFDDGQFPYWGEEVPVPLTFFGRGISQFAKQTGATATPTVSDGLFRIGYAKSYEKTAYDYAFASGTGDYLAGGDSGGPSFAWVLSGYALVGVHSHAAVEYVPGMPTQPPWTWVSAVHAGFDAPIRPVADQISALMGPNPFAVSEPSDRPKDVFVGNFATNVPSRDANAIAAFRQRGAAASSMRFAAGFPNFYEAHRGLEHFGGTILIRAEGVEWRDVPLAELPGASLGDFRSRMKATQAYATAHGFVGGFPTFYHQDYGAGIVCGAILLKASAAEWRDVPVNELGNPNLDDFELRFRATQDYANREGFVGGFPNLFHAENTIIDDIRSGRRHKEVVCGTVLVKKALAQWADVLLSVDPR